MGRLGLASLLSKFLSKQVSHSRGIQRRLRSARFEQLEDRALLSVSAVEYETIRATYEEFALPTSQTDVNVIEISAVSLSTDALKEALEQASSTQSDDLIVVRTSESQNTITFNQTSDSIVVEQDASIFGKTTIVAVGDKPLTIDANGLSSVLEVAVGKINLGNLVLTNGTSRTNGGIVLNKDVLVMKNCVVANGAASDSGLGSNLYSSGQTIAYSSEFTNGSAEGIASVYSVGTLTLSNCSISENLGGGLYVESDETSTLVGCSIANNLAYGIVNTYGSLSLTNCAISNNHGAGLINSGTANVATSTISNNVGGIVNRSFLSGSVPFSAALTVERSKIISNESDQGAGIYNYAGSITLSNSEFSSNAASASGGAVYCAYESGYANKASIVNCTIAGNTSGTYGGGLYIEDSFSCSIYNTIVSMNYAARRDSNISGSVLSRNSLLGASPNFVVAPVFDYAAGTITNRSELDLCLATGSAAINIGDSARAANGSLDLSGNTRIYGKSVDAGAYEYSAAISASVEPSYVVTTLEDSFDPSDGATSLREAIYYAKDSNQTITFSSALSGGVIKLNSQLVATSPIKIDGGNAITIDAQDVSRAFLIEDATTLIGLTLTNGLSSEDGGLIYAQSDLTLESCALQVGSCGAESFGGLVYAQNAFTAINTTFTETTSGDALYLLGTSKLSSCVVSQAAQDGIDTSGDLTLESTVINGNAARGVANNYGVLTASNSTISNNGSFGVSNLGTATLTGGKITGNGDSGLLNDGVVFSNGSVYSSSATLLNVVISGNSATNGAGIYNRFGRLEATNSEISANAATNAGGGIYTETQTNATNSALLNNCTIAGNVAGLEGGGIAASSSDSLLVLYNTIVSMNLSGDVGSNVSTDVDVKSGSYIGSSPGFITAPVFDFTKTALTNGDALDLRLGANSSALNTGVNANVSSTNTTDLDGNTRVYGGKVDPGAYEYQGTGEKTKEPVYVVNTLTDAFNLSDSKTTLREALFLATNDGGTITFASSLSGSIKLKSQLVATCNVTINGDNRITLTGQNAGRVFVNEGDVTLKNITLTSGKTTSLGSTIYNSGDLTLRNVTVTFGSVSNAEENGSVYSVGNLTCYDSTISKSKSGSGVVALGKTTFTNCVIKENASNGIYAGASVKATDCSITANANSGIYNNFGTLELKRVKLSENIGAGLTNLGSATLTSCSILSNAECGLANLSVVYSDSTRSSSALRVYLSTIKGNSSSGVGAGIYNVGGFLELDNSEVSGNNANAYGGGVYCGYVENCSNKTNIVNCTIAGNSANKQGGGIYIGSNLYQLGLYNTIVAKNYSTLSNSNVEGRVAETIKSLVSGNPSFVVAPIFDANGRLQNADQLNLRLTAESVAVDFGNDEYVVGGVDLSGADRVFNNKVDLGAYEYYADGSTYVTTLDDSFDLNDDKLSLREALYFAKNGDVVSFDPSLSGEIILTSALEISSNIILVGTTNVSLDGNGLTQLLRTSGTVTIQNTTFSNGRVSGSGGAIYNSGDLTLENCVFLANGASQGGAIYNNAGATLSISNVTFRYNSANSGGAIYNSGTLSAINALFSENTTTSYGGSVYNSSSAFLMNTAIVDSKSVSGGGIYANSGALEVVNCTIANNTSTYGGGIYVRSGATVNLYNSILALNSSDYEGASSRTSAYRVLSSYEFTNSEGNYIYDSTRTLFVDATNRNYKLASDSQAIDLGDDQLARQSGLGAYSDDLSGRPRRVGTAIDLGAYECIESVDICVQEGCAFSLKADASATDQVYWDLSGDGTGTYERTSSNFIVDTRLKGLSPGFYTLRSKVVSKDGTTTEKAITLHVTSAEPVIKVETLDAIWNNMVLYTVDARFLLSTPANHKWRVDWGDGSSTIYTNDVFTIGKFYEADVSEQTYAIELTLVGDDGQDEFTVQIGAYTVPSIGADLLEETDVATTDFECDDATLNALTFFGPSPKQTDKDGLTTALDEALTNWRDEENIEF